jgi:hypothetical protein
MGEKKARRERNESLPIERKETYRWISRAARAKGRLSRETGKGAYM